MNREPWMTAEEWLVTLLCRLHRSPEIDVAINETVKKEKVDPELLEHLCANQRIYPQFLDALQHTELQQLYSEKQLNDYRRREVFSQLLYLKYEKEVLRIQRALDEMCIRMVVFKGLSYYGEFYPSRKQRSLGDVDVIIAKEDIVTAVRCLERLGYRADGKTEGWTDEQYQREAQRCIHTAQFKGPGELESKSIHRLISIVGIVWKPHMRMRSHSRQVYGYRRCWIFSGSPVYMHGIIIRCVRTHCEPALTY